MSYDNSGSGCGTLFVLIVFLLTFIFFYNAINTSVDRKKQYENQLGTKYVLESDTLTVVDYSILFKTFELSNGQKINAKLILKDNE